MADKGEKERDRGTVVKFRTDSSQVTDIEHLLRDTGRETGRRTRQSGERSKLLRELISRECQFFRYSPYFARTTHCTVFITAAGAVAYWLRQELYLVEGREFLPSTISMKPEKKTYFENLENVDLAESIRDAWLLSYFAAWEGEGIGGKLIADGVDSRGITTKFVDLPIDYPQDSVITREILVVGDDYVQRQRGGEHAKKNYDDRVDVPIDIPALELDVQVMVDLNLYSDNEAKREIAALDYEIRNREYARFRETKLGAEKHTIRFVEGRSGEGHFEDTLGEVRTSVRRMGERIKGLANASTIDGEPIVARSGARETLQSFRTPKDVLFSRFTWSMPYMGLVVCPTWNKPDPPSRTPDEA